MIVPSIGFLIALYYPGVIRGLGDWFFGMLVLACCYWMLSTRIEIADQERVTEIPIKHYNLNIWISWQFQLHLLKIGGWLADHRVPMTIDLVLDSAIMRPNLMNTDSTIANTPFNRAGAESKKTTSSAYRVLNMRQRPCAGRAERRFRRLFSDLILKLNKTPTSGSSLATYCSTTDSTYWK